MHYSILTIVEVSFLSGSGLGIYVNGWRVARVLA